MHSNGRGVAPSEAEEEAYQLSYLKKHLANIIALLAEPAGGEDEQSPVSILGTWIGLFIYLFLSFTPSS